MASSSTWLPRLAEALGPVGDVRPLGGGAWRVELARAGGGPPAGGGGGPAAGAGGDPLARAASGAATGGRPGGAPGVVVAKVGPGVLDEAEGLRTLAAVPGAPPVPDVLLVDGDLLVTALVPEGRRTGASEEELGRSLAALHRARAPHWGGGSSWIGACPVDPEPQPDGPTFLGRRLVDLAGRCGLAGPVGRVVERLDRLAPFGEPAVVHGDLWWGNVLWGADGRGWVIDPSAHGGHPEEDLAMLALFGSVPDRLLAAYREVRPLDGGWEGRVGLWQLVPLLVHTVLFGGSYRAQAEAVARRYGG